MSRQLVTNALALLEDMPRDKTSVTQKNGAGKVENANKSSQSRKFGRAKRRRQRRRQRDTKETAADELRRMLCESQMTNAVNLREN